MTLKENHSPDSPGILESALDLECETLLPRVEFRQVPAESGVIARLVHGRGPAGRLVGPGAGADGGGVGERVRVVDVEGEGDVGALFALDGEVAELERGAGEFLLDLHLPGRWEGGHRGGEECGGGGDEGGELHGGGDGLFGGLCLVLII